MTSDDPTVLALAEAVADGSDVDWAQAELAASDPATRIVIQHLGHLARLGAVARAQSATWGPLEIRETIGSGTFGTVYHAWDPRLERHVALKLLHTSDERLIREGRLLAKIRHPNVVTVYGADVFDGRVGIWMEFVVGSTLKTIVETQGPYGALEAALIGRDVCRALAAVHREQILHRDIKAQNVMREGGGRTVLMDFGAGEMTRSDASSVSAIRGTPVYLAPELFTSATPTVQSDLYSLGVLLFFLVTGTFPVTGASLEEIVSRHARGDRTRLRDVRADLPAGFVRAVEFATAANPVDRPGSAGAFEAMLDDRLVLQDTHETAIASAAPRRSRVAIAATAMLAVAIAAGTGLMLRSWRAESPTAVAISPFVHVSNDPETVAFSQGVTEKTATRLTDNSAVRVIAAADARVNARTLGAAAAMHASVTRSGSDVRVDAELVDARTGETLWQDRFARDIHDPNAQLDISQAIADAVKSDMSVGEAAALGRRQPRDWETFALYQSGRYFSRKRLEDALRTSLLYYQKSLEHDPEYAPAYAGIADSYTLMGVSSMMGHADALSRALAAASRAVDLDPLLAEAQASLGYVHKQRFEWELAESRLRRAIELKPTYAQAHHWYSIYLSQHGRFPEAVNEAKTAISLDPQAVATNAQLGTVLSLYRRYDDSIAQFGKVLTIDPKYTAAYEIIGENYTFKHDFERAIAAMDMARKVAPLGLEDQEMLADRALAFAMSGRRAEAEAVLAELLDRQRRNPNGIAAHIATTYGALGNRERAFEWLGQAIALRDRQIGYLKVDPRWDSLRGDPRFDTLLARIGFGPAASSQ